MSVIRVHLNLSAIQIPMPSQGDSYLDLDSHADTCVLGNNALIIESPYPERTALVSFADPSVGSVTKSILSGALLYTTPTDGTNIILVIHQAIHITTMDHSLLAQCNCDIMMSW